MTTTTRKSTMQLLRDLVSNLRGLARERAREIEAERREERAALSRVPVQIGTALAVTLIGAVLVGQALAHGLAALGVPLWLSYALLGVVTLVIGIVMMRRMPDRSEIDTVPETALKRIGHDIKEIAAEVAYDVKTAGQPRHVVRGEAPLAKLAVTTTE